MSGQFENEWTTARQIGHCADPCAAASGRSVSRPDGTNVSQVRSYRPCEPPASQDRLKTRQPPRHPGAEICRPGIRPGHVTSIPPASHNHTPTATLFLGSLPVFAGGCRRPAAAMYRRPGSLRFCASRRNVFMPRLAGGSTLASQCHAAVGMSKPQPRSCAAIPGRWTRCWACSSGTVLNRPDPPLGAAKEPSTFSSRGAQIRSL
jgi:hypothetical protein